MATCYLPGRTSRMSRQQAHECQDVGASYEHVPYIVLDTPRWVSYPQRIHISSTSSRRWDYFHDHLHSGLERELAMVMSPIQPSSLALENVLAHLKGVRSSLRGWKA